MNLLPLPSLKCTPQVSHTHPPPLPPWWLRLCNKDFQTLTLGICVTLGRAYAEGKGVQQDQAEALRWYRKAAEQGHREAQ